MTLVALPPIMVVRRSAVWSRAVLVLAKGDALQWERVIRDAKIQKIE